MNIKMIVLVYKILKAIHSKYRTTEKVNEWFNEWIFDRMNRLI